MAIAFISSILSKTSQVLGFAQRSAVSPSSSSDPRSRILKDLKELEKTLKWIQAVLHDAEEREIRDESVKLWLKDLKEVAYQADDVLDEYQYEARRAQVEGRASRKRKREVSIPDSMGDRIRQIREDFDKISKLREQLRLREEDGERRVLEAPYPAPTSHMVDESSIYGREHDKQEVIDLLFSEGVGNGVSVIPIVGKGGLGKTTIAQLVYNDPKVKQYFNLTGWICVSDDFDVPRLTKAIIESLTRSSCDLTQLSTLQDTLKKDVKGKRVLLVLDDVWNEQQSRWESLRYPFVGAEIVRIIVTCRNDSVAEIMQTMRPYHPSCLSPEQSWSLFRHYTFGGRDPEEQPRLVDMGKQIVKKCSGLPLALKSVGSFLRYTTDEDSWMDVIQSDVWEVDENDEILPALRLSYSRMPAYLKPCFIYCSMFPKDYPFDKYEIVRLWMAQGYIPSGGRRRSMEDIGDEYFNDLQRRSFFDWTFGSRFKMHDMIHDLAKSIAGNECCAIVDEKLPDLSDKIRHLYVDDEEGFLKSLRSYNLSALRTLLPKGRPLCPIVIPKINKYLPRLRCLRTLHLFWERKDEIPDLFGNLKHLRYLGIISEYTKKLPESICLLYHLQTLVLCCLNLAELPDGLGSLTNLRYFKLDTEHNIRLPGTVCQLHNLQTLDLNWCWNLEELPSGIGSLTNLRHLHIQDIGIRWLPAGIKQLTNLQSLCGCYKVQDGIGVLKNLVNPEDLLISGLRNMVNIQDAWDAGLKYKHKLKTLVLAWNAVDCKNYSYHELIDNGLHVEAFLEANKDVPADEKREEAMLEYLQPHANLKMLHIEGYGGSKFPEWVGNPLSFESLREIHIIDCEKIRCLPLYIHESLGKLGAPISKSMLERVCISGCRQLTSIAGLHNLPSLKELEISFCPQLQILSEEGLPSNLQRLFIKKCQQLTSLPGMQNLASLEVLTIKNCPQLRLLSEEGLSSNLRVLHIKECQLASLLGMQNLVSLEVLTIKSCPQLRLLAWEGLPSKLKSLSVEKCQQLASLSGMQNLTSFRQLNIKNCPQLQFLSEEGLPSSLRNLHIAECQQLTSLLGMQNLTSLKVLTIKCCPQLRLLSEEGLSSRLLCLLIKECQQLTSLPGIQNLTSLKTLIIQNCPELQIMVEDRLSSMPDKVKIVDCPGLNNWCQIQNINCIEVPSIPGLNDFHNRVFSDCNKLTISNKWGDIMHGFDDLTSIEHLYFSRSWKFFQEIDSISVLEELTIWGCTYVPPLEYLPELTSLRSLVIKDCPRVRLLQDELLPSMLKSLVVDSCENLSCLQLVQQNRDALEKLQIVNCPKIVMVQGLNRPFFPKFLTIEQCPQLPLSQDDCRPFIPPRVEIIGVSETKFYPLHSEKTENKETIDDGTQEKQVLDCAMIEHANSAASSIFDAADDCNMGQFLQLGLPFSCSSRSLVQITVEPSLADMELVAMMDCEIEDNDCNHDKIMRLWDHLTTRMETMGSRSSKQPCAASISDPGPSRPWQLSLPEPPMICPQQQDLAVAFLDSQPFNTTARQSDATMTYINHDHSAVSPIFDEATDNNIGQFLQLGRPSGCGSQSSVHNNAEPSN